MWNTFRYTVVSLMREKTLLFWALLFPIVLGTLFNSAFSHIDESYTFTAIPTAIVADANYENSTAFAQVIDTLSASDDDQTLDATFVGSVEDADALIASGSVYGYITVDEAGTPTLSLAQSASSTSVESIDQTILKEILDEYLRSSATLETIAAENPQALSDGSVVASLSSSAGYTQQVSMTAHTASGSVRYFYALLGFAALIVAQIAILAITRTQANLSALGARRTVGATSRSKTLVATLLASWLLSFICIVIAYGYLRFGLGIDFGGRDAACLLAIAVASLMTTAFGACVGAIPKLPKGAKSGMLSGLTSILALFAGLYGTASQQLGDDLARSAPLLQAANPVKQVTDLFYSLYFYDTYTPFLQAIGNLMILTAVFALIATLLMRRQRYASL
jgi:ABC-2 type transport system permease protein